MMFKVLNVDGSLPLAVISTRTIPMNIRMPHALVRNRLEPNAGY
jgi:hypothetical protein